MRNIRFLRRILFMTIYMKLFACVEVSDKPYMGSKRVHRHFVPRGKIVEEDRFAFLDVVQLKKKKNNKKKSKT